MEVLSLGLVGVLDAEKTLPVAVLATTLLICSPYDVSGEPPVSIQHVLIVPKIPVHL